MGNFTLLVVLASMLLSFLRIMAIQTYYVAPLHVAYHFESFELPAILTGMGYTPIQHNGTNDWDEWDLSPIKTLNGGTGLRLCYGKEWHRFTSSFLVPEGVEIRFIKSDFDGALPAKFRRFPPRPGAGAPRPTARPPPPDAGGWWRRAGTKYETLTLNDQNEESSEHYVSTPKPFSDGLL
jgi:alpha-1,2-mannosyltransferase